MPDPWLWGPDPRILINTSFAFVLYIYLRPGEPVHGVGADFEGQLPAIQHLVKPENNLLIGYATWHLKRNISIYAKNNYLLLTAASRQINLKGSYSYVPSTHFLLE